MKLEGVEPPAFGSGIRRAANCAIASHVHVNNFESIPRPGIEPGSPGWKPGILTI